MHYLMEGSLVPVFLQELLLTLRLFIASAFGIFHILFESLFLGQRPSSFNLFPLQLPLNIDLLATLGAPQLP